MNILITGGVGYLGTSLVRKLDQADYVDSILLLDNFSRKNYSFFFKHSCSLKKVEFIKGDILDSRTLNQALEGIDVVYHLAAKVTTPFADQDPHFFEQINHWGTANVVNSIEKSGVSRAIYLSSVSVYGSSSTEVDENVSPDPKTYYGISKLKGEKQFQRLENKLDTFIIRSGNVYGYNPSARFDAVINKFMFEANFFGKITIFGSGEQSRAFIHIDQLTEVLAKLSNGNSLPNGIFNVVGDNWSIESLSRVVEKLYPDLDIIYTNQDMKLRQLKVDPNLNLMQYMDLPSVDLEHTLQEFKRHFIFS